MKNLLFPYARYQVQESKRLHIKYVPLFVYLLYLNKAILKNFKQTHSCDGMLIKLMTVYIRKETDLFSNVTLGVHF